METKSAKFEVLKGLKILLKFEELYPANWFTPQIRTLITFCFRTMMSILMLFEFTTIWLCVDAEWDLNIVSGPLCFLLGGVQIFFIYFDILSSKLIIINATDSLQVLVQESNLFEFISFHLKFIIITNK